MTWRTLSGRMALGAAALLTLETTAWAVDRVSGVITRTYVIVEDTELKGDVVCDVASDPCFSFGAPDTQLKLNGFTITGKADPVTGCGGAVVAREVGIATNGLSRVAVRGPGLIQRFRNHGVSVTGSTDARVEEVTVSTNCGSGIFIAASSFGTLVQDNTAVRNGSSAPGFACGGIWIVGHNSRVRLNEAHGNGYAEPADDFGIGVIGSGSGNLIEENLVAGNTNGILLGAATSNTVVRQNTVVGNPAIQTGNSLPATRAVDILNLAPPGANTFDRNVCVTAINASCPDAIGVSGWRAPRRWGRTNG